MILFRRVISQIWLSLDGHYLRKETEAYGPEAVIFDCEMTGVLLSPFSANFVTCYTVRPNDNTLEAVRVKLTFLTIWPVISFSTPTHVRINTNTAILARRITHGCNKNKQHYCIVWSQIIWGEKEKINVWSSDFTCIYPIEVDEGEFLWMLSGNGVSLKHNTEWV